jgi:hypothetical protein
MTTQEKIKDQLEDYIEYLVQIENVKGLQDLTREERAKLSFLVLRDNKMYVKMIRIMHNLLKAEINKQ